MAGPLAGCWGRPDIEESPPHSQCYHAASQRHGLEPVKYPLGRFGSYFSAISPLLLFDSSIEPIVSLLHQVKQQSLPDDTIERSSSRKFDG